MHTHEYEQVLSESFTAIMDSKCTVGSVDRHPDPSDYHGWFTHEMSLKCVGTKHDWSIHFKRLSSARATDIESYLLRYHHELKSRNNNANQMIALLVPRITKLFAQRIISFLDSSAPQIPFALVSEQGGSLSTCKSLINEKKYSILHLPDLTLAGRRKVITPLRFSETDQLLLKKLIYNSHVTKNSTPNSDEHIRGVKEWAVKTKIGYGTTQRLAEKLKEHNYLTTDKYGNLNIRYAHRLFNEWFRAAKDASHEIAYVDPLFSQNTNDKDKTLNHIYSKLKSDLDTNAGDNFPAFKFMYCGWTAVGLLGLRHVISEDGPLQIVVNRPIDRLLQESSVLHETSGAPSDALLKLVYYPKHRHIFYEKDNTQFVDPIQAALDVANDDARGREQAEHILGIELGIFFDE